MPESPRWLLGKGKNEEAFAMFSKIKRINGAQVSNDGLGGMLVSIYESLNPVRK